jgi:hypothetical protein
VLLRAGGHGGLLHGVACVPCTAWDALRRARPARVEASPALPPPWAGRGHDFAVLPGTPRRQGARGRHRVAVDGRTRTSPDAVVATAAGIRSTMNQPR